MKSIRVGDPLDKNSDMGAINHKEQFKKIKELVEKSKKGKSDFYQVEQKLPSKGYYFSPCLFDHCSNSDEIIREEIFGPVLSVMTFRTPDEAILKANDTRYGLAAGIWSEKGSKIHYTAGKLKAGVIWANTYNKFDPTSPFGGFKESGFGREGGLHGLYPYLRIEERK